MHANFTIHDLEIFEQIFEQIFEKYYCFKNISNEG